MPKPKNAFIDENNNPQLEDDISRVVSNLNKTQIRFISDPNNVKLMDHIRKLLKKNGLEMKDLDAIIEQNLARENPLSNSVRTNFEQKLIPILRKPSNKSMKQKCSKKRSNKLTR